MTGTPATVLMRMKWRVLRNSLSGRQAALVGGGALVGLVGALATVVVAATDFMSPGVSLDMLAAVYLVWTVGWLFAPVFTGGGDETLRPEHFALLPLTPRRLAGGLLAASFVGVPAIVTFLALCGLLFHADGVAAVLVAVVAVPLQLAFVVLLSRVVMAALGAVLRSRRGRDLGVLLAAFVGLSGFAVQYLIRGVGPVLVDGRSETLSTVLRALPSGWGAVAVDAAGDGSWALATACLAGFVVLIGALLLLWGALLVRRTTRVAVDASPGERRSARTRRVLPTTPVGAVASKELRTWFRDARRRVLLLSMLVVGVIVAVVPAASGNGAGAVPFAALAVVVVGCLQAGNLYGMDGSALWHTLVVPDAEAADVRGRQLAWLLIVGPVAVVLAIVLPGIARPATYPWVLALVPTLLGGGAGLILVQSVVGAFPMSDQRTGSPFAAGGNPGILRVLLQIAIVLLLGIVAVPVLVVVAVTSGVAEWLGVPLGIAVGVLCWWFGGRIAQRRLLARGPELLAEVRRPV